jgi:hypothetical protein
MYEDMGTEMKIIDCCLRTNTLCISWKRYSIDVIKCRLLYQRRLLILIVTTVGLGEESGEIVEHQVAAGPRDHGGQLPQHGAPVRQPAYSSSSCQVGLQFYLCFF